MHHRQRSQRFILVLASFFASSASATDADVSREACAPYLEGYKVLLEGQYQVKAIQLKHQYKTNVRVLEARQRKELIVLKAHHQKEIMLLKAKIARLSKDD